jgi:HAD superfamily phosphoserine phosphatase-like hydrolase
MVAFDLDGTLLRGETVCESLARALGHGARMHELERAATTDELRAARAEMAGWYAPAGPAALLACLAAMPLAPGVANGFALLRRCGVATAIVSITWEFAVAHFARALGADHHVGTRLGPGGAIEHFWPADKPVWLAALARQLGAPMDRVAAVGDSAGDVPMLLAAGAAYFVGTTMPSSLAGHAVHCPDAAIDDLARLIVRDPAM